MKVYLAYIQYYEDRIDVGIFSTKELAQKALDHFFESDANWVSKKRNHLYIDELGVDQYIAENLSPLANAMSEDESL